MIGTDSKFRRYSFDDGSNNSAGSGDNTKPSPREKAERFRQQHQGTSKHTRWQQGLEQGAEKRHVGRKPNRRAIRWGR